MEYTYPTLVADIKNNLEEDSDEFDSAIPTIISRAEVRLLRDLDLAFFEATSDVTATAASALLTKPANMITVRDLYWPAGTSLSRLDLRTRSFLLDYWPDAAETGTPVMFCEESETQWRIAPTPVSGATVKARCLIRPSGLAAGNPTTWLATKCGEAMFYASMIESEIFLQSDTAEQGGRIGGFEAEYTRTLAMAAVELKRARSYGYAPMKPNQGGGQ